MFYAYIHKKLQCLLGNKHSHYMYVLETMCVRVFYHALYENVIHFCMFCLFVYIPFICIYGNLSVECFSLNCKAL